MLSVGRDVQAAITCAQYVYWWTWSCPDKYRLLCNLNGMSAKFCLGKWKRSGSLVPLCY